MYAAHRAVVPRPFLLRLKRDCLASLSEVLIIPSLSLSLLLSRLCGTAVATEIYTYFLLSSPYSFSRVLHRASSSLLYSFTVSRPVRPPLFSPSLSARHTQLRGERPRLFVRAFHSRSLVLSLSFVSCNTLLCRVSRPLAFLALPPPPPFALRTLRSPFPPCPSPLSPTSGVSVVQRARRVGAQKHAARPC